MRRIVIVGLGGMGRVHLANWKELADRATIVAAVGKGPVDEECAASKGLDFHTSLAEAMAAHPEADTVDISTPSFLHRQMVEEALRLGLDVICEKPLALDPEDARDMLALSHSLGRKLLVAMVCRYTKEFLALKETLGGGEYGKLEEVSFSRLSETPAWSAGGWLHDRSKSGLVPFDLMVHDIDMMLALLGTDIVSRSVVRSGRNHYHLTCRFRSGTTALVESGWIDAAIPFQAIWRATFEKAVLVNDGSRLTLYRREGEAEDLTPDYPVVIATGINVPPTGWYYEELKALCAMLEGEAPCTVSDAELITALELAKSIDSCLDGQSAEQ